MNHYKLLIAYDGTDYAGWQVQDQEKTIAGTLEKTFLQVFGKEIHLYGASRTDAGVHALGQVATLSVELDMDPQKMLHAWSNSLPPSILIRDLVQIPEADNPRFGVSQKTYHYHYFTERPLPLVARYGWYYRFPLNEQKLKECFTVFVGKHDFRSFCTGDEYESTVRTVDAISLSFDEQLGAHRIVVKGQGFLRYMIRRIVGACLYVASHDTLTVKDLAALLEKRDPEHTLPKAPALGLMLYEIRYKKENFPSEELD